MNVIIVEPWIVVNHLNKLSLLGTFGSLGHPTKSGWGLIYPLQILWIPPTDFAVEQKLKFLKFPPKGTYMNLFEAFLNIFDESADNTTHILWSSFMRLSSCFCSFSIWQNLIEQNPVLDLKLTSNLTISYDTRYVHLLSVFKSIKKKC